MIIEQLKIDAPKNLFLVHWTPKVDQVEKVIHVKEWLDGIPGYAVLLVPNGQPCPTNPLPKITLYNASNPVLCSIVEKIAKYSEHGAMITLSNEEMEAWVNSQSTDWVQI